MVSDEKVAELADELVAFVVKWDGGSDVVAKLVGGFSGEGPSGIGGGEAVSDVGKIGHGGLFLWGIVLWGVTSPLYPQSGWRGGRRVR